MKKAQVGIYVVFWITLTFIVIIAAVMAPIGIQFSTKMYEAGENIIIQSNDTLASIQDADARDRISDMYQSALGASENNIEVNTAMYQYGWVFAIVLSAFVLFIYTRRVVEYTGGGII